MHIDNTYEKLVKQGYIEAGTLVIRVDDITKLELSSQEVKPEETNQKTRQDKSVVVIDNQGRMKKVSSLLLGYNKKNIQLADGSFANANDLLVAMQTAVSSLDSGTIVVNKKGEVLDPQSLLKVVKDAAGKLKIGQCSPKVTNQDNRYWSVEGAKSDVEYKKGIVFLGKESIDLKSGDYISVDELLMALNEYMVMKPESNSIIPEPNVPTKVEPLIVRVVHKYKNNLSRWLVLLASVLMLASGIKIRDNVKMVEVPVEYKEKLVQMIEQNQLNYIVNGIDIEFTCETIQEAQRRIVSEMKLGDEVSLQNGDELYSTSELTGSKTIIGSKLRKSGNYQISGVSIVYNGSIYAWYVDPSIDNPGLEIGNFINETITKNNLDLNKIDVRLHLGNSSNYTRTGWIDISKLIKEDSIEQQVIKKNATIASTYTGTISNFTGQSISMETINGPVTLNILDVDGKLLKPGTTVIGSDGREYMLNELSESIVKVPKTQNITTPVMEERQIIDGKKITWSIQDCSFTFGIAPLLVAIATAVATRKKNEQAQENPSLFEFENEEKYLKFKKEFEMAKEDYEKNSKFKRMLKNLFYRKEIDLLQKLTKEQVQQLYIKIKNCHTSDYSYNPDDKIEFRNGKVIIVFNDGRIQDITDIVMPSIANIGRENKVETEGLLKTEEEQQNEVHRR